VPHSEARNPTAVGSLKDPPRSTTAGPVDDTGDFEILKETRPPGLVRRFLTTQRHFLGLLFGGLVDRVRTRPRVKRRGLLFRSAAATAFVVKPFLQRSLRDRPFPVQLRRRLETLGPTYIKLGQILSLRRDLLPESITSELSNLLDRLPVVPFERFLERVAGELPLPVDEVFAWIDRKPLGSASIAQIHRGRLITGEEVILKLVKPGIRESLERDSRLLWLLGHMLQALVPQFQPRQILAEFVEYTLREVDLRLEADNAETFSANFRDDPDVVFPAIYRQASTRNLLTMEYLDGFKPSDRQARRLSDAERDRLVDLGAASIIQMIYRDGFFHADLHPGNLLILPGTRVGYIDLGMVGRFSNELRRALLYYYYSLVSGDAESAARYLSMVARPMAGADPDGFRREVTEIGRRWQRASSFRDFSLGQLILRSVGKGAEYRMYFPVEMVLMVKAIVTYEGVGQILKPGLDVAAVSRGHIQRLFLAQFSPWELAKEGLKSAPELMETLMRAPMLVTEGLRFFEIQTRQPPERALGGVRGTILGGFLLLCGVLVGLLGGSWWAAGALGVVGLGLALRRGRG
jgi:ubiquinone biosynthesis protein